MTTPFLGEIQLFGFNYAPSGWAACNGATLPISQYSALYSLIGTSYGGNGTSNFQLPNLAARMPCSQGFGPGRTGRSIGETFGDNSVTLTTSTMAIHNHMMNVFNQPDVTKRSGTPATNYGLIPPTDTPPFVPNAPAPNSAFSVNAIGPTSGGNVAHENRQPYLALNFCIALNGVFPSFG